MKRAVAYIRVSTKSDAQSHSFEYQREYWQNVINNTREYDFIGVYADWGISGRSLAKRHQLLKLIEDAKEGKFDVVFTKSVSRLGRNTVELLQTVRTLRELGIKVIFEKENIDTSNPGSELYLTIAASVAQSELETYSDNQRWSYKQRFKNGYIQTGNRVLGYKINNDTNSLEVVKEEVATVKRIFELYLDGLGIAKVVLKMTEEGWLNGEKKCYWSRSSIRYILRNERYKGCVLSQKGITINGQYKINRGQVKQYYMEDTHEAIISKEDFDRVQVLMNKKACQKQIGKTDIPIYPFTSKVVCGVCKKGYNHKFNNTNKPWRNEIWSCSNQNNYGKAVCDNTRIKDEVLKEKFVESYNEFIATKLDNDEQVKSKNRLADLVRQENELKALKVNRLIERDDYNKEVDIIRKEIKELTAEISASEIRKIIKSDCYPIEVFDEEKVDAFIDKVIIFKNHVTFRFINGVEITKEYSNGPSGNQKGWKNKQVKESD